MVALLTLLPCCGVAVLPVVCVALSVLLETVRGGRGNGQQTAAVPMRVVLIPIMGARLRVHFLVCAGETVAGQALTAVCIVLVLIVTGCGAAVLCCSHRYIEVSDCVL